MANSPTDRTKPGVDISRAAILTRSATTSKIKAMPRALIATAPQTAALVDYREPALSPGHVRLHSVLSVVKHGSELRSFRAYTRDTTHPFDR